MEGDERGHLIYNEKGEILTYASDRLKIADKKEADSLVKLYKAGRHRLKKNWINTRGENRIGLLSGSNFPTLGSPRSLVILVDFLNKSFSMENPQDFYHRMMNDEEFNDYDATGSAGKYLRNNSRGLFSPIFDVIGPVTLPQNYQFYGENIIKHNDEVGDYLDDSCPFRMLTDACEILKLQGFDFSPYDYNQDGEIDNIYLFYAGFGEADGGAPATVWPHSGNILEIPEVENPVMLNGLILNHYACSNELKTMTGKPDGFGTFIHEFSHILGFPDLYPLNGGTTTSPDDWDVMDTGCYLNNSYTPPNYSTFELYAFGWIDPIEITEEGVYELPWLHSEEGKAYIIHVADKDKPDEFFIFENRQQKDEDTFLPGHGMLVWHIDFNQDIWDSNSINSDDKHPCMRIIEADNLTGHYEIREEPGKYPELVYNTENEGDTFPGTTNNTSFTSSSTPAFLDWNNNPTGFDITDIKEDEQGLITFTVTSQNPASLSTFNWDGNNIVVRGREIYCKEGTEIIYDSLGRFVTKLTQKPVTLSPGIFIIPSVGKVIIK